MKKIINGKLYNTETAELLEMYQYLWKNHWEYYREELYRTKKEPILSTERVALLANIQKP